MSLPSTVQEETKRDPAMACGLVAGIPSRWANLGAILAGAVRFCFTLANTGEASLREATVSPGDGAGTWGAAAQSGWGHAVQSLQVC
jgi:hypothetical protein